MKTFRKMLSNMKPMEEMDTDEKDTVMVSCIFGLVIGVVSVCLLFSCIGMFVLVVATQP